MITRRFPKIVIHIALAVPLTLGAVSAHAAAKRAVAKPVAVAAKEAAVKASTDPFKHFEHLGGMADAKRDMLQHAILPLLHPELFTHLGAKRPGGILITGPRGTGKTSLAKAAAEMIRAQGGEFVTADAEKLTADGIEALFKAVDEKAKTGVTVAVFIDELHALGGSDPKKKGAAVVTLTEQIENINAKYNSVDDSGNKDAEGKKKGRVVLLAASHLGDSIDQSLTRKGFFDAPIELSIPDESDRLEIIKAQTKGMKLTGVDLNGIVKEMRGWTGADIAKFTQAALHSSIARSNPKAELAEGSTFTPEMLAKYAIKPEDFAMAKTKVRPAGIEQFSVQPEIVHWDQIGGLKDVKAQLKDVVGIFQNPQRAEKMGIKVPKGVVLEGEPGTGKTMLAKAMATEAGMTFIEITPTVRAGLVGQTEQGIAARIEAARHFAPAIVFIDEADSLLAARGSRPGDPTHDMTVNMLLAAMDGARTLKNVYFVLATNRPDLLDEALVGPGGRLKVINVPKPGTEAERLEVLVSNARGMKLGKDVDLGAIVKEMDGWVPRRIKNLAVLAGQLAFRDKGATTVDAKHFRAALEDMKAKGDSDAPAGATQFQFQ